MMHCPIDHPNRYRHFSFIFCIACFIAACTSKTKRVQKHVAVKDTIAAAADTTAADTMYEAFLQNKYYFSTIISLDDNDSKAFAFTDSAYFGKDYLTDAERYDYYKKVRPLLPKEELKAHRLAWRIKELRAAQHGDGGYTTLLTWTQFCDTAEGLYELAVKTNDVDHLSSFYDMPTVKVWPRTGKITVSNMEYDNLSLKEWRRQQKEKGY